MKMLLISQATLHKSLSLYSNLIIWHLVSTFKDNRPQVSAISQIKCEGINVRLRKKNHVH